MSIATASIAQHELPPFTRHRWTVADFLKLVNDGFLPEGDRTFLWDGEIYQPMPESPAHRDPVEILRDLLPERFPRGEFTVNTGKAILLEEYYRPQPDITVLRGIRAAFAGRDPVPEEVVLLIEVANTSYAANSGRFRRRYARAGIGQYWIVHIDERRIEVYSDPIPDEERYGRVILYGIEESVPLLFAVGEDTRDFGTISVREVLVDSSVLSPEDGS